MIQAREAPFAELAEHVRIRNAFEAEVVFDVVPVGARYKLCERRLITPFSKDYDQAEDPMTWAEQFDTRNWALFGAFEGSERVGGAVVAHDTPAVDLLEDRKDLAVVWDLRVAPRVRRRGVGAALFRAVEEWAHAKGCRELKVETQNTNVGACRFYSRQGCELKEANVGAYGDWPEEVQLFWRKRLER